MPDRLPDGRPRVGDHAGFRLAVFAGLLVVTLFAGYGLGRLTGTPAVADPARAAPEGTAGMPGSAGVPGSAGAPGTAGMPAGMPGSAVDEAQPHVHAPASGAAPGNASAGGLAISANGLTLVPQRTTFTGRESQRFAFTITGAGGAPVTGSTQPIVVRVTSPGGRAAALEPYLGAFGHLVVMRLGDLGYVHVHPEAQLVDGGAKFWLAAPSAGTYRMFFDFQVGGEVHTAAWTVTVT